MVAAVHPLCALCGTPATRHITARFHHQDLTFCCYGCRHIYDVVWPDLANGTDVRQAMGRAGFDLSAACCRGMFRGEPIDEAARTLSRLMFNAFLAMMIMVLSLALYSDFFFASWGESGRGVRSMLQAIIMLFATPAVLMLALPILEDAVFTFQISRRLTTSALIAVGSLAAYGLSVYATFTGRGDAYFETATMTLLLVTLGRWLDAKTQVEGNRAFDDLLARTPTEASVIASDDRERRVSVDQLRVGDRIRVRPGEQVAVDGWVVSGTGSMDESSLTGESMPAYKACGHTIYAGTVSLDGSFVVEATQVGDDRVMGKWVRLLEEARLQRAPIEQLVDRVAANFAPAVMLLAMGTFGFWLWHDSLDMAWHTGLAVLLIACPCALGMATPLTIWAALGRAAQNGVLIRDSRVLETLSHVRRLFFDKTGTLTTGRSMLQEIVCDAPTCTHGRLLQLAASLEQGSEHPLADAMQTAARARGITLLPLDIFRAHPGLGVSGRLDDKAIIVGSWRLVAQQGLELSETLRGERQRLDGMGLTVVHVGWDGRVQGLLGFAETLRPTAQSAVSECQRQGLALQVLTGDRAACARALSRQLDVAVRSELLPHDKVGVIEAAATECPVAMVGDGLNDAPALARANVGIALGCGADLTREAADVSLVGNDLTQIAWTLALARRAYRTIGWNLIWAFVYNVVGIGFAMAGLLHPVLAATAMVVSSALVVGNALRIRRF
jgi:Cu+-exporting ATPase